MVQQENKKAVGQIDGVEGQTDWWLHSQESMVPVESRKPRCLLVVEETQVDMLPAERPYRVNQ